MKYIGNCPVCGRPTTSWLHCAERGRLICQTHCETCRHFSGKTLWTCWYKPPAAARQKKDSSTVGAVMRLRDAVASADGETKAKIREMANRRRTGK